MLVINNYTTNVWLRHILAVIDSVQKVMKKGQFNTLTSKQITQIYQLT